jgi:AcrR family transcriptional regulator
MTDGFQRRREQSKEEIRRAAWELFGRFGVERVSMADIARKAGVSQATIYNNFGSKDALAREFVTGVIDRLVEQFEARLAPEQSFWDKMAASVRFVSEMMGQAGSSEANPVAFGAGDLLDDPEIRRIRESAEERMGNLLLELVREGQAQGEIRAGLSEDALRVYFTAFMDMFTGPQFQALYVKDPRVVDDLGTLMIDGMRGAR